MSFRFSSCASAVVLAILFLPACTQVRGRKRIREANELYHRGKYAEAVTLYKEAEALVPDLPVLWLNEGYTCRQLIAPGSHDPESRRAAACALAAFRRLGEVAPEDRARRRADPADLVRRAGLPVAGGGLPRAAPASPRRPRRRPRPAGRLLQVGEVAAGAGVVEAGGGAARQRRRGAIRRRHLRLADPLHPRRRPQMAGYSPWPDVAGTKASMTIAPPATDHRATSPARRASRWPTRGSPI